MRDEKNALRDTMRGIAESRADVPLLSGQLTARLLAWPLWMSSRRIAAFSARADEPDILTPWPEDKLIALPRVIGDGLAFHQATGREELVPGKFGIGEPSGKSSRADKEFDLIFVPGLAFDSGGGRLGRGKGFYDRFLSGVRGIRVGSCFDDQIVDHIPMEAHDLRMDFLVTPSGIFRCDSGNSH